MYHKESKVQISRPSPQNQAIRFAVHANIWIMELNSHIPYEDKASISKYFY